MCRKPSSCYFHSEYECRETACLYHPERPWTRDMTEHLTELYERGYTLKQMAGEMGRTTGYILGRLWDMGEQDIITPAMRGIRAKGDVPRLVEVGV